jgi:hypothetical protein
VAGELSEKVLPRQSAAGGAEFDLNRHRVSAHSITSSAVANSVSGMIRPSVLAALILITSSNLVGYGNGASKLKATFTTIRSRVGWQIVSSGTRREFSFQTRLDSAA